MGSDLDVVKDALNNLSVEYYDEARRAKEPEEIRLLTALNRILLELHSAIYKLGYTRERRAERENKAPSSRGEDGRRICTVYLDKEALKRVSQGNVKSFDLGDLDVEVWKA